MEDTAPESPTIDSPHTLRPPQVRQPYTPPPQKPGTVESISDAPAALQNASKVEDIFVSASPVDHAPQPNRDLNSKARKYTSEAMSLAAMIRRAVVDHQLGLSVNLALLVALSWVFFPGLRESLTAFFQLSYPSSMHGGMYGQGPGDLSLVVSLIVIFTGFRAFMLDYVLVPAAGMCGISKRKAKIRFGEQSYLILYYTVYWSLGVYLFVRDTPTALPSTPEGDPQPLSINSLLISLWTHYPRIVFDAPMKLYYLSQLAFWLQQIMVIHLEEMRKDHYQMLTHHFVTVALLSGSYAYRQLRVGNAVLICMDIIDIIFPTAKIFRYLGWQAACDMAFALFVVAWLACRHVAYLAICWSIYAHVHEVVMPYGLYSLALVETSQNNGYVAGIRLSSDAGHEIWANLFQPFVDTGAKTVSFNANIRWTFLGLLLGLQAITLMWFVMICRVIARVLRGEGADDSRSDDEDEDIEDDADLEEKGPGPVQPSAPFITSPVNVQERKEHKYIEVEASPEQLTSTSTKRTSSSSKRKSKGLSTGLNLGEHKEILNRIGCLSEEQLAREREKRSPGPATSSNSKR